MRFTIRDLLWLTVVVALVVGWLVDRRRVVAEREAIRAQFQRYADARYEYDAALARLPKPAAPDQNPPKK